MGRGSAWCLVTVLTVSGCLTREDIVKRATLATSLQVGCPESSLEVGLDGWPYGWTASGCKRAWSCTTPHDNPGAPSQTTCTETQESRAETETDVVVDRLALETGCDRKAVKVVSQAAWSRAGEKAYRLDACGRPYVCTTAPGRTDCKAALAAPPAAAPASQAVAPPPAPPASP